jgi:hypothetical protein
LKLLDEAMTGRDNRKATIVRTSEEAAAPAV